MVTIYCHLGRTPLGLVILINVLLFVGISARMIATSSLISAVPELKDRGAFMSVNSSLQQFAGGTAAALAGLIVVQTGDGRIEHYGALGGVVVAAMVLTLVLMYSVHKMVMAKTAGNGTKP
jgi:predicted MFS family arabinose efflux permease